MVGNIRDRGEAGAGAVGEHAQAAFARLRQREHRVVHAVIDAAAGHVVERAGGILVAHLDRLDPGDGLVHLAHDDAGGGGAGVACGAAVGAHGGGERRHAGVGRLRVDREHEGLAVEGGGEPERFDDVDRGRLEQVHLRGGGAAGAEIERVAIRPGARRVLDRNGAVGAGLVFDDDGAAGERADFFGEEAGEHVGAAAGREAGDEMEVLIRIVLRARGRGGEPGCGEREDRARCDGHPPRSRAGNPGAPASDGPCSPPCRGFLHCAPKWGALGESSRGVETGQWGRRRGFCRLRSGRLNCGAPLYDALRSTESACMPCR